jgi:hypothetical protein
MNNKILEKALLECYIELYKNSEPPADFKQLMETDVVNDRGEKVIDFNSYEIDSNKFEVIFEDICKKYKIKDYNKRCLSTNVYLGCSPKIKK